MCNCIKETEKRFRELYPDAEAIEYENVELLSGKVYSTVNIVAQGKKKPKKQLLLHSYCPICGQKYEK